MVALFPIDDQGLSFRNCSWCQKFRIANLNAVTIMFYDTFRLGNYIPKCLCGMDRRPLLSTGKSHLLNSKGSNSKSCLLQHGSIRICCLQVRLKVNNV